MKLISVGYYNYVPSERIVIILDFQNPAARKLREAIRAKYPDFLGYWIMDFTKTRKARSCILLDTGQIILSIRPRVALYNELMGGVEKDDVEE